MQFFFVGLIPGFILKTFMSRSLTSSCGFLDATVVAEDRRDAGHGVTDFEPFITEGVDRRNLVLVRIDSGDQVADAVLVFQTDGFPGGEGGEECREVRPGGEGDGDAVLVKEWLDAVPTDDG